MEILKRYVLPGALFLAIGTYVGMSLKGSYEHDIDIRFEVEESQAEAGQYDVKIKDFGTTSPTCLQDSHEGCFNVPKGEYGQFTLTLNRGDENCFTKNAWRFYPEGAVVLGGYSTQLYGKTKPDVWGDFDPSAAEAVKDFDADMDSGIVDVLRGIWLKEKTKFGFGLKTRLRHLIQSGTRSSFKTVRI